MGFKDLLGKAAKKIEEKAEEKRKDREERKRIEEEFQEKLQRERQSVLNLLDKFDMDELSRFCKEMIGKSPEEEIINEIEDQEEEMEDKGYLRRKLHSKLNRRETADRKTYYDFIERCLEDKEIKFSQIKDWALREQIVMPSYFKSQSSSESDEREFEIIIEKISQFVPEKFNVEQDFEDQLVIYLKANFPKYGIERQVKINENDRLDVLINHKFALELKVPSARSDLRNLKAQLEEYKASYPLLCAVVFEDIMSDKLELNREIREFSDVYRRQLSVPTIIIEGERRPAKQD